MDFNRILNGMIRAARLDKNFYEEVEHDTSYNQDALMVVGLAVVAGGIGGFLLSLTLGLGLLSSIGSLIGGLISAVISFYVWVYLTQYIGTRFFHGTGDVGEVQRALGFAYAPQILNILAFIPCAGWLIPFATLIWSVATGFVAIRQSLDQDDKNAGLTMVVSFLVLLVLRLALNAILRVFGLA